MKEIKFLVYLNTNGTWGVCLTEDKNLEEAQATMSMSTGGSAIALIVVPATTPFEEAIFSHFAAIEDISDALPPGVGCLTSPLGKIIIAAYSRGNTDGLEFAKASHY